MGRPVKAMEVDDCHNCEVLQAKIDALLQAIRDYDDEWGYSDPRFRQWLKEVPK